MWRRSGPLASAQVSLPEGGGPGCVPAPTPHPHWHHSFPASIPLEAVRAKWERTCGPYHKQRLAEYYGLYRDLFHGATFVPRVPLHVAYAIGEDDLVPVYYGNEVTPTEVTVGLCPSLPCVHRHIPHGARDSSFLKAVTEAVFMVVKGTSTCLCRLTWGFLVLCLFLISQ